MNLGESLRMSWRSIRSHRLRSTLTTLGIVIGVAAVITFVTLGASLQAGVLSDVSPDDRDNFYVWTSPENESSGSPWGDARPVFTRDDAATVAEMESVRDAYVYSPLFAQSVAHNGSVRPQQSGVIATGEGYLERDELAAGRLFRDGAFEVVVNRAAAGQYPENLTVGERVTIALATGQRINATVVGVLQTSESQGPLEGLSERPRFYVPVDPYYTTTASGIGEEPRFSALVVEPRSASDVDAAKAETRTYLESDAADAADRDEGLRYNLKTSRELISQLRNLLDRLTGFVTGVALVSLLVGALGIANIMLVSVTERTREIGIMKAVGAQNRDVLRLFLTEAVLLGSLGSVVGVVLGFVGGYVAAAALALPLTYRLEWVPVAVAVGVVVGVLAGIYPAWDAARTDPIEALRYE